MYADDTRVLVSSPSTNLLENISAILEQFSN